MDEQVAKLVARLEADVSDFKRGMNQADSQIKKTSQGTKDLAQSGGLAQSAISALGGVMLGVFSVATVRKIAAVGLELNSIRVQAENVTNVFTNMYRDSAGGIAQLRQATSGVVADLQLMQSASLLASTGLADNVTEAAHIMQNAMLLGTSFGGTTATQALDSILPTLTNQSALRLDMFGMSGDQVQKLQDQYEAAGMASGEAFAQAFLDVSDELLVNANLIDPVTGTIEAQEDATTGLSTAWDNVKTALAQYLDLTKLLSPAAEKLQIAADNINTRADAIDILKDYKEQLYDAYYTGAITAQEYNDAVVRLNGSINATRFLNPISGLDFDPIASSLNTIVDIRDDLMQTAKDTSAVDVDISGWQTEVDEVGKSLGDVEDTLDWLESQPHIITIDMIVGTPEWAEAKLAAILGPSIAANDLAEANAIAARNEAALILDDLGRNKAIAKVGEELIGNQNDTLANANNEYEALLQERQQMLENYASSALTLTSVTDRDWWETNLGEYNDKPDEYIRRLNAALNDANSEWAWMLGGRTGDAAQLYVAQQSDLWTSGQWGGLGAGFDAEASRQAIIDSIRQNVTAQRAREALIQSIITDPALADIGLTASEIAGITGDTDTLAEGVASSLATTNIASIVTNSFGDQLQAEEQVWVSYGELIVTWLKVGMSNNNQMASGLAELLFPELQEMFEGRQ